MNRSDLLEGVPQRVLQRQVLHLQRGVVALQLLQAGAHDVQDGALDGPHGRRQGHVQLHHFWLVLLQHGVDGSLKPDQNDQISRRGSQEGFVFLFPP